LYNPRSGLRRLPKASIGCDEESSIQRATRAAADPRIRVPFRSRTDFASSLFVYIRQVQSDI
jgi:hypothetical protein